MPRGSAKATASRPAKAGRSPAPPSRPPESTATTRCAGRMPGTATRSGPSRPQSRKRTAPDPTPLPTKSHAASPILRRSRSARLPAPTNPTPSPGATTPENPGPATAETSTPPAGSCSAPPRSRARPQKSPRLRRGVSLLGNRLISWWAWLKYSRVIPRRTRANRHVGGHGANQTIPSCNHNGITAKPSTVVAKTTRTAISGCPP